MPNGPPVIAAGGIATGAQVAGLLTMGADGVVLGTRFLFTPECCYTDAMKKVLVESGFETTERSNAYDQAFETDFWPSKIDGRAINTNDLMKDYKAGLPLEERIKRFKDATAAGQDSHLIMWAGVGVAHTNKISPAAVSVSLQICCSWLMRSSGCLRRSAHSYREAPPASPYSVEVTFIG